MSFDPVELMKKFNSLSDGDGDDEGALSEDDGGFSSGNTELATASGNESASGGNQPTAAKPADPAVAAPAPAVAAPEAAVEPKGVQTKDGGHIIPYAVLQRERAEKAAALARVEALQAQINQHSSKQKNGDKGGDVADPARSESEVDIESLKEDFPVLYAATKAQQGELEQLRKQLQPLKDASEAEGRQRAASEAEMVQDAIDSVPDLSSMLADPDLAELAKHFDNALKLSPAWRDKPLKERFTRVAEMVKSTNSVPGAAQAEPAKKTVEQIKSEAMAAAKQAAVSSPPVSLSDFPAGGHDGGDGGDWLKTATTAQLAQHMAKLSQRQREALLESMD